MKLFLLLLFAYILGFLTAIPIGATQIEIIKRSMKGFLCSALMIALASATSDVIYGLIAFFGIAPFIKSKLFITLFLVIGIILLLLLSVITFKKAKPNGSKKSNDIFLNNKKMSYIVGFSLAATNPPIIFWWLAEIEIAKDIGIYNAFNTVSYLLFLLFGGLGLFSYLSLLSFVVYKLKRFISTSTERKINIVLSIILALIAIYFVARLAGGIL